MKKEARKEIDTMNITREQEPKTKPELSTGLRRLRLTRNPGGSKQAWRFDAKAGKLERQKGSGIDWYQYWKVRFYSYYLLLAY